jgi:CHASE1-domain containing sensor protein
MRQLRKKIQVLPVRQQTVVSRLLNMLEIVALLALFAGATFGGYAYVTDIMGQRAESRFVTQSERLSRDIKERSLLYEQALLQGKVVFETLGDLDADAWRRYTREIQVTRRYPGMQGFGFITIFPAEQLAQHINSQRVRGNGEYKIHPQGKRDEYSAVIYFDAPAHVQDVSIGYDMLTDTERQDAMYRARDSGSITVSKRVLLANRTNKTEAPGFIMFAPVYKDGASTYTVSERRAALQGFVFATFVADAFMESVIRGSTDLGVALYDRPEDTSPIARLYWKATPHQVGSASDSLATDIGSPAERAAPLKNEQTLLVADSPWTIIYSAQRNFGLTDTEQVLPQIALVVGALFWAVLCLLIYMMFRTYNKALTTAEAVREDTVESVPEQEVQ